jgi:hypothetical protein
LDADEAILFGTASEAHLAENLKAFRETAG